MSELSGFADVGSYRIVIITIYIFYREFNNCGRRNRDRDMGHHGGNSGDGDGKCPHLWGGPAT